MTTHTHTSSCCKQLALIFLLLITNNCMHAIDYTPSSLTSAQVVLKQQALMCLCLLQARGINQSSSFATYLL